jgi:Protein of unknown function (DUF5672)
MKSDSVIIVIIAHQSQINEFEKISLQQCFEVLGKYPIRLVCPSGLDISCYQSVVPEVEVDFIDPVWQSTYENFNRLKIVPLLYRKYQKYKFILFYELDAFVFRDELEDWCEKNYDYIGAPWFDGYVRSPKIKPFSGVGNGGFSLRKVNSALRALHSFSYIASPQELLEFWQSSEKKWEDALSLIKGLTITNNTFFLFNGYTWPEDIFWGKQINQNFDWFTVPNVDEALKFSFERNPNFLFKKNQYRLPFGCHAWWKDDLEFWLPHIQKLGYLKDHKVEANA